MFVLLKQNSSFIWRWCIFTAVGWALGLVLAAGVTSFATTWEDGYLPQDMEFDPVIVGTCLGTSLGVAQWLALRAFHIKFIRWAIPSMLGWMPSLVGGFFVLSWLPHKTTFLSPVGYLILGLTFGFIGGVLSAFGQWLTCGKVGLDRHWIWLSAVAWSCGAGTAILLGSIRESVLTHPLLD
jgi:hypothetical protein